MNVSVFPGPISSERTFSGGSTWLLVPFVNSLPAIGAVTCNFPRILLNFDAVYTEELPCFCRHYQVLKESPVSRRVWVIAAEWRQGLTIQCNSNTLSFCTCPQSLGCLLSFLMLMHLLIMCLLILGRALFPRASEHNVGVFCRPRDCLWANTC